MEPEKTTSSASQVKSRSFLGRSANGIVTEQACQFLFVCYVFDSVPSPLASLAIWLLRLILKTHEESTNLQLNTFLYITYFCLSQGVAEDTEKSAPTGTVLFPFPFSAFHVCTDN